MRALGIDPGSRVTGWGVVEHTAGTLRLVGSGTIRLKPTDAIGDRLARLFDECTELLRVFAPTTVAVERNFVARNVQSAFRLGETRGVVLAAAARAGVPVSEHTPSAVKLAAVGYGAADKDMVQRGVCARLGIREALAADAADALAIALCWLQQAPLAAAVARAERRVSSPRPSGVGERRHP